MEVAELQEKIREVYKLINYQNVEFEWNEQLRKARKILNDIQSKLHQPTVSDCVHPFEDVVKKEYGHYCLSCNSYIIEEE
jgi:tyrosine-protein phosphatase YwqE